MRMPLRRTGAAISGLLLPALHQMPRQRPCFNATALVQLTKICDGLLNHPNADTNAANQAPIAMNLAVLLASRVALTCVLSRDYR
jgi:hypothetical protein